ncbi:MAG: TPM domain-containing protein [Sphingobacteriales bacterium]|jgi:uncharacterized protein|nr:TPM domain-containing protein [Sphingobacteriales bacterium]
MTSPLNKILAIILLTLHFFAGGQTLDKEGIPDIPTPFRLVNDFASMLSNENRDALETKLLAYNDSTSTQIYIVCVETIGDYSIEDFALRLGRKWGIGQKDKNNGVLILVSKNDRKVDIEIGYGLESYVTDYDSKHIIDELIVPAFKQNNYYRGLEDASNRLIELMQGTFQSSEHTGTDAIPPWAYILIIVFIVFIAYIISSGKSSVSVSGGGWTWNSGGGSSWSGGGSSWGGGGGFSGGGGGSFGGGGSSGSW